MKVVVDTDAATPAYDQVRTQIARMVGAGVLPPGARLPTIQQLSNDLRIAPGTVARAYKELERDGVVVSKRRTGTLVADAPPKMSNPAIDALLTAAAEQFVLTVRQLGAQPADAIAEVRRLLE